MNGKVKGTAKNERCVSCRREIVGTSHYGWMIGDQERPWCTDCWEGRPQRYMTVRGKKSVLAEWERYKAESPRPEGDFGGHGYPDPEVEPLCAKLNAMPYLCTLQSCAGHRLPAADGSGEHVMNGQLWIWPTQVAALRFYKRATKLAQEFPLIQRVQVLWQPDSQEVIDVCWQVGRLAAAESVIVPFFESLQWGGQCYGCDAPEGVRCHPDCLSLDYRTNDPSHGVA